MADWAEVVRRNHQRAQGALAQAVNRHSISVPIGDSDATAPGYLFYGNYFSCVPDAAYPWDPHVLALLRTLLPSAMPISIRSVYRWSNYHERGYIDVPMVVVRHGVAKADLEPGEQAHDFYCEMPSSHVPGLAIPGRRLEDCRPRKIVSMWYDRDRRPWGHDMPGAYLPFDIDMYEVWKEDSDRIARQFAMARLSRDEHGEVIAKGAAAATIEGRRKEEADRAASRMANAADIRRDIESYYKDDPSDVELRDKFMGGPPEPQKIPSMVVPALPED